MYPQSLAWMDAKSHYICLIILPCVFSNYVPNCLHLWSITTHVALFHVGFSPECAVMVFYVLSQNVVRYHISTTQISNKMCWNYFSPECGVVLFTNAPSNSQQKRMQSHTGCIGLICRPTLSLLWWPRQACDSSKLNLFPHISQDSSSGWDLFLWLYLRSQDACQASGKPKNDARRSFAIAFLRDSHPKKYARPCTILWKCNIKFNFDFH